jgi:glutaredoxin
MDKLIIYTTPACPYCHSLMDWLDTLNITYEEINAETLDEIDVVPETHIGNDKIIGFDRPKILKSLKKHGIYEK